MIIVTNSSTAVVRRAATNFKPGENKFANSKFTDGAKAQIEKHAALRISDAVDEPAKKTGSKK